MAQQLVLCPLIGSGEGTTQSKILRFQPAESSGGDIVHRVTAGAGDVIAVTASGIYSVSATIRFQCLIGDDPVPWSSGWGITLNTQLRPTDWTSNFPKHALAWALLPEPSERERQREPMTTLSWVGFLAPGDELRIESERPNPRLYQGAPTDRLSFVRIVKLLATVA